MTSRIDVQPACCRRATVSRGVVWVYDIELSYMGKTMEIPNWWVRKILICLAPHHKIRMGLVPLYMF